MLNEDEQWYEVEPSRSNRSKCKECKDVLVKDSLRIGIKRKACDHFGDSLGWFHPPCLWKTFSYKSHANPRIKDVIDIKNFDDLSHEHQEEIESLIASKGAVQNPKRTRDRDVDDRPAKASTSAKKGILRLKQCADGSYECNGDTFQAKDELKAAGARWNGVDKNWNFPPQKKDNVVKLFQLDSAMINAGSEVVRPVNDLCTDGSSGSSDASTSSTDLATVPATAPASTRTLPPAPAFAMAGTLVVSIEPSQDIALSGDVAAIAHRFTVDKDVMGTYTSYKYSTEKRREARDFLCMHDDLPSIGQHIEIDLAELGQKHAASAGVEISASDLEAAEERLRIEQAIHQESILKRAQVAVRKAKPANEQIVKATFDALSLEERFDWSCLGVACLKKLLAARGLPTSGKLADLKSRLLLAGTSIGCRYSFLLQVLT